MIFVRLFHRGKDENGDYPTVRVGENVDQARTNVNLYRNYLGELCSKNHTVVLSTGEKVQKSVYYTATNECVVCNAERKTKQTSIPNRFKVSAQDKANAEARRILEKKRLAKECGVDPEDVHLI